MRNRVSRLMTSGLTVLALMTTALYVHESANKMRESRERFEAQAVAAGRLGAGFWRWDTKSDHIEWSNQLYEVYGIRNLGSKRAYDHWLEIIHPEDRAAADAECQRLLNGEIESYRIFYRVRGDAGEYHNIIETAAMTRDKRYMYGLCIRAGTVLESADMLRALAHRQAGDP